MDAAIVPEVHQETGNVTLRGLTAAPATQVHSSALRAGRGGTLSVVECGGVPWSALEQL